MREILFRGKTYDGEWIEGSLINAFEYTCILQSEDKLHPTDYPYLDGNIGTFDGKATPVIPETVGQYTGMTDKNGKKIFEGDIISFTRYNALGYITSRIGKVCYGEDYPAFYIEATTGDTWCFSEIEDIKVIGNIHDNPELMKGE